MLSKLLPVVFLLVGTGAGIGAGLFLLPDTGDHVAGGDAQEDASGTGHGGSDSGGHGAPDTHATGDTHGADDGHGSGRAHDYVKMTNQFVVPVVDRNRVTSLVVVSLSLEVKSGYQDQVYALEPKLRDGFLQVLFNHANMGGFGGAFTDAEMLTVLRNALRDAARRDLGDVVNSVLIVDIVRQDV